MNGMKKFVMRAMQPRESLEERVKRLAAAPLPGVTRKSLDLYYNDLAADGKAYTARLEMWLDDLLHYRVFHARCASFDAALEQVRLYENGLTSGKQFIENPEVTEGKKPEMEELVNMANGPFETRAEFTTWTDVLDRFNHIDKKGDIDFNPRLVSDLPRLRHGMAVAVPVKRDGAVKWITDWFDYARYDKDGKDISFVCIHDHYSAVYPLDPWISSAINEGKPIPNAHRLWLKKTTGDVKAALKGDKEKTYTE